MFKRSDHYLQKFQSLCGDTDCTMQINDLRQIILFRSNGLCPGRLLFSVDDGSLLSCRKLCNEATYGCVKRKNLLDSQISLETFIEKSRQHEIQRMSSLRSLKDCAITESQRVLLKDLLLSHDGNDCKTFRKRLSESKQLDIVAIHVCRWDGSPRKSVAEIVDAICIYPSSPQRMNLVLKVVLGTIGVIVAGAAYKAMDHLLWSEAGVFSKMQCHNTTVHLIGESHDYKIRNGFLDKFVDELNQEPDNAQSVVFVEYRPWDSVDEPRVYVENSPEYFRKMRQLEEAKRSLSPVIFFGSSVPVKHYYLPRHTIVFHDYRDEELYETLPLKLMNGLFIRGSRVDDDMWKSAPSELKKAFDLQHERLLPPHAPISEEFSKLATRVQQLGKDFVAKFQSVGLNKFDPSLFTNQELQRFETYRNDKHYSDLSLDRNGTFMLLDLNEDLMSLADEPLAILLKSYVARGTPNVYAFMGSRHMPNTEALLKERLDCHKIK